MTKDALSWRPAYHHGHVKKPPMSMLNNWEDVHTIFAKLQRFLWIKSDRCLCPAEGWPPYLSGKDYHRHLFTRRGFHLPVRWSGKSPDQGWRNLAFDEFISYYGLKEVTR